MTFSLAFSLGCNVILLVFLGLVVLTNFQFNDLANKDNEEIRRLTALIWKERKETRDKFVNLIIEIANYGDLNTLDLHEAVRKRQDKFQCPELDSNQSCKP